MCDYADGNTLYVYDRDFHQIQKFIMIWKNAFMS